ncbi:hypothetical protein VM98_34375, partial [Streptomyces rubellomurinus subsp. indigoferus]
MVKRWITNAGVSEVYTVMAMTDPSKRSEGISAFLVGKVAARVSFEARVRKLWVTAAPRRQM